MTLVAALFSLLYVALTLVLAIMSIHGPSVLRVLAPLYLVSSLVALWWSRARLQRKVVFLLVASGLAAAAGLVAAGATAYDDWKYDRHRALVARIEVWDLEDDVFLTEKGNPIGIRIQFAIRFPAPGVYSTEPFLTSAEPPRIAMQSISARERDAPGERGFRVPESFEAGRAYRLSYDVVPSFIGYTSFQELYEGKATFCLREPDPVAAPVEYEFLKSMRERGAMTLLLSLGEAPVGSRPLTKKYSFETFYQACLKEGLPKCP